MEKFYYTHPMQVRFLDLDDLTTWRGGIVWRETLIAALDGLTLNLNGYLSEMARDGFSPDDCLVEMSWKNFEREILTN